MFVQTGRIRRGVLLPLWASAAPESSAVKRIHRLRRPSQFRRVRREGQTINHPLLRLQSAPNRRRHTRCGFVVGKYLGKAVQRNRAKRRVRETMRLYLPALRSGYDLVLVVRSPQVIDMPFSALQATVYQLLRRASLWRADTPPPA